MTLLKNNIIWCNAMCLCGLRFIKHIIFHILYIIVAPLCPAFLKRVDFYKAHRSEKRGVLWLASHPVRCDWPWIPQACDGNVTPLTILWCRVLAQRHKNNKTRYKWGICYIQWGQNYWSQWFTLYFYTSRRVNITMSAFVIRETTNKLYTAQNSRLNSQ